jgi:hypothetical protein
VGRGAPPVHSHAITSNYFNVGAVWFGGTFNAEQGTFTAKLQIVAQGAGTVGRVNLVGHFNSNGREFTLDFATCMLPE